MQERSKSRVDRTFRSLAPALLTLPMIACGDSGGATGQGATPESGLASGGRYAGDVEGLILSRSLFDGTTPQPAAFIVLYAPDEEGGEWTRETVIEEAASISLQPGSTAEGRAFVRRMEGETPGPTLDWKVVDGEWTLAEVTDVDEGAINWATSKKSGKPSMKTYEQKGGNVFHKAMWFDPIHGEPGILTISANVPAVKIWRRTPGASGEWQDELLYTAPVGGKEQRYRDIEVGDVDGDGEDELVMATHDRGGVYVFDQTAEGLEPTQIAGTDLPYIVHEIELGDLDGDGVPEIFSTPSETNKLNNEPQLGEILMHDFVDGEYRESFVEESGKTHAKEILAADIDQDGKVELYSAMEGEGLGSGAGSGDGTTIKRYDIVDGAVVDEIVMTLPGKMCRFLTVGETDGDGELEILAATRENGVFKIEGQPGEWEKATVASPIYTGGFEHAMCVIDLDGDGIDEVITASDKESNVKNVYRFYWNPERKRYSNEKITVDEGVMLITWGVLPLPVDVRQ